MRIEKFQGCYIVCYKQFTAVSDSLGAALSSIAMQMRSKGIRI